jgi:hypothetical protein
VGIFNPVFTGVVGLAAYMLSGPASSLMAVGLGAIKDGSLWAGIHRQVEQYFTEKGELSADLSRIKAFCEFVEEGDVEMYDQAKTQIIQFFDDLKLRLYGSEV